MFLSLITKNLNLEILTKNLVTFKRWDEVKDSGSHEKLIYRRELPKKGGLDSLQIEGEGGTKKRGGAFEEGGRWESDTPRHSMNLAIVLTMILIY